MAHEENQLQKFCNFYKLITKGINVINSISVRLQNYRKYSKKHYFKIKVARETAARLFRSSFSGTKMVDSVIMAATKKPG